jgi:tRNA dimethylallyltransferase
MEKLLIICGPTATGKTNLGIKLAKKLGGEIVSADSRQVYRGMDIITGKEVNFEIKTWLIDLVNPDEKFNVADYYGLAWKVIEDIWKRGKLPIVVGGTGFYFKALLEGIGTMGVGPDWELRKQLTNYSINELTNYLDKIDPERSRRMNESDRKNPRRLIRAIEVVRSGKGQMVNDKCKVANVNKYIIGLRALSEVLYKRIDQRVEERVKMGAEEEIKKLISEGYNWENSVMGHWLSGVARLF